MKYTYTFTACKFSIATQAVVNNLMPILFVIFKDEFGISYTLIAGLTLLNFLVQIVTDGLAIKIIKHLGYRKSGILAELSAIIGLLSMSIISHFIPKYPALLIATVFCAFGGGLLEVMASPIVDALDLGERSARMSMLHSFYCWGQVAVVSVSTTAIHFFSPSIWWVLPILWSIIPLISIIMFSKMYIPAIDTEDTSHTPLSLFKIKTFVIMCVLMFCAGASEITMALWASVFAQKGLGVNKFIGDMLGPCLFAILMGLGRAIQGIYGDRMNLKKTLTLASLLCAICYIVASVSKNQYIALLACAVTGLSVSIMWPGVYSYSSSLIPHGGTSMFGILALFGDIGCSLGSYLCGMISDYSLTIPKILDFASKVGITPEQIGLKIGVGITAIFPIIMLVFLLFQKSKKL